MQAQTKKMKGGQDIGGQGGIKKNSEGKRCKGQKLLGGEEYQAMSAML